MFSESTQSFLMTAVQVKRCVDYRIQLLIIKLKYSGVFTCINNEGLENFSHQLYIAIISVTFGYFAIQYWEGFYTTSLSLSLLLLTVFIILCHAKIILTRFSVFEVYFSFKGKFNNLRRICVHLRVKVCRDRP